jgi:hypothetical protein
MNETLRREAAPASLPVAPPPSPASAIRVAANNAVVATAASTGPLTWELLVTDGHVRAARLRRIQPWIVVAAALLLLAGFWVAGLAPGIQPKSSVASIVGEKLAQLQTRATAAFTGLASLAPRVDRPDRLPPEREIPEVVRALMTSLGSAGELPSGNLTFTRVDAADFWAGTWGIGQVSYLKSGDTYLLGAYVHLGPSTSTQPVRWVGAVKKVAGKWQYASLGWTNLYLPPGLPSTSPQAIALSLDPFLPSLPASKEKK